jgi:hypothetical protein
VLVKNFGHVGGRKSKQRSELEDPRDGAEQLAVEPLGSFAFVLE